MFLGQYVFVAAQPTAPRDATGIGERDFGGSQAQSAMGIRRPDSTRTSEHANGKISLYGDKFHDPYRSRKIS